MDGRFKVDDPVYFVRVNEFNCIEDNSVKIFWAFLKIKVCSKRKDFAPEKICFLLEEICFLSEEIQFATGLGVQ